MQRTSSSQKRVYAWGKVKLTCLYNEDPKQQVLQQNANELNTLTSPSTSELEDPGEQTCGPALFDFWSRSVHILGYRSQPNTYISRWSVPMNFEAMEDASSSLCLLRPAI